MSELIQLSPHVFHRMELRATTYRLIADAAREIEGEDYNSVFSILCNTLQRICKADYASIATFNRNENRFILECATNRHKKGIKSIRINDIIINKLIQNPVTICKDHNMCFIKFFSEISSYNILTNNKTCYRICFVYNNILYGIGMVQYKPDHDMDISDMVEQFVQYASKVIYRIIKEKEQSRALEISEEKYKTIYNSALAGLFSIKSGAHCILHEYNCYFSNMFRGHELKGKSLLSLIADKHIKKQIKRYTKVRKTKYNRRCNPLILECQMRIPKDGLFWAKLVLNRCNRTHSISEGFVFNITREKEIEHKLEYLNNELEQKVEERTKDLQLAYNELDSFSYSVSHDLKSPLRKINGMATILLEEKETLNNIEATKYLSTIVMNTSRLGEMIDSLLLLSHTTKSNIKRQQIDISNLVQNICEELIIKYYNVKFRVQQGLKCNCDYRLAKITLQHLLSNAFKFSQYNNTPVVKFGKHNAKKAYYIRDNGCGLDAEKINNKYNNILTPNNTVLSLKGIGLNTVKRIVNKHNGSLWFESNIGLYTSVFFTFGE